MVAPRSVLARNRGAVARGRWGWREDSGTCGRASISRTTTLRHAGRHLARTRTPQEATAVRDEAPRIRAVPLGRLPAGPSPACPLARRPPWWDWQSSLGRIVTPSCDCGAHPGSMEARIRASPATTSPMPAPRDGAAMTRSPLPASGWLRSAGHSSRSVGLLSRQHRDASITHHDSTSTDDRKRAARRPPYTRGGG